MKQKEQYYEMPTPKGYRIAHVHVTRIYKTECRWTQDKTMYPTIIARMSDGASWYAKDGGTTAWLTFAKIRKGTFVEDTRDEDVFNLAHGTITEGNFERLIMD